MATRGVASHKHIAIDLSRSLPARECDIGGAAVADWSHYCHAFGGKRELTGK